MLAGNPHHAVTCIVAVLGLLAAVMLSDAQQLLLCGVRC